MEDTKPTSVPADPSQIGVPQGSQTGAQWGQTQEKQYTPEEINERQRTGFIIQATETLKRKDLSYQDRKNLTNQMKLASKHVFWDTQPVKKFLLPNPEKDGHFVNPKPDSVSKEPIALPSGFEWVTLDMEDEKDQLLVHHFLNDHFLEDEDGIFRLDTQVEFLKWVLCTPNKIKDWHIGVKATGKDNLLGFVAATPMKSVINKEVVKIAQTNFLCVHKKLRKKKLAPILIKEITRRVNLHNVWSGIFTSGEVYPHPFTIAPYFHRSLNTKKAVETGFSALPPNEPLPRYVKRMKIHGMMDMALIGSPRQMESRDIQVVYELFKTYTEKYSLHFKLSQNDIAHHLLPRNKTVYTIVFESEQDGKPTVTDFISFYSQPYQVLKQHGHSHSSVNSAYLYYYAATKNSLTEMVKYAMHFAKELADIKFDLFNCLNIMEYSTFVDALKFGMGDGTLNYYMYNYQVKTGFMQPNGVAAIIV